MWILWWRRCREDAPGSYHRMRKGILFMHTTTWKELDHDVVATRVQNYNLTGFGPYLRDVTVGCVMWALVWRIGPIRSWMSTIIWLKWLHGNGHHIGYGTPFWANNKSNRSLEPEHVVVIPRRGLTYFLVQKSLFK